MLPLALAVGKERTAAVTYPVPHDFAHATIGLEVTLQGHGITSHHGWERLNVDSQVAYGKKKENGELRARGDQEGWADLLGVAERADATVGGAVRIVVYVVGDWA